VGDGQTVRHRVVQTSPSSPSSQTETHAPTPHRRQAHPAVLREQHAAPAVASRVRSYGEWKSWIEAVVAAAFLVLLLPLFVILAILVKLTSPGPVFYGAIREGLDGRVFRCWKFRSMRVNADAMQRALAEAQYADGPQFKIERDPRITPIGGWLRAWNLDELPQLANVVLREMSFVGPRPSPFEENQICVPWRDGRLSVRPGITGLWQVCRRDRAEGDFHQWILYDLLYVAHASFWVDVRIFVATIVTLGGRRPAPLHRVIPGAVPSAIEALVEEEFTAGRVSPPPTIELSTAASRRLSRSAQRTPRALHGVEEPT
jgi:lipopolysaccharide/colanic/teichoic acid biosynthesis glycosyltransferase